CPGMEVLTRQGARNSAEAAQPQGCRTVLAAAVEKRRRDFRRIPMAMRGLLAHHGPIDCGAGDNANGHANGHARPRRSLRPSGTHLPSPCARLPRLRFLVAVSRGRSREGNELVSDPRAYLLAEVPGGFRGVA